MYYSISEFAKICNIHPNTIKRYEEMGLFQPAPRQIKGNQNYSVIHVEQTKLIKMGFQYDVIQGTCHKLINEILLLSAKQRYEEALEKARSYYTILVKIQKNAENAQDFTEELKTKKPAASRQKVYFLKSEILDLLEISEDTLRNWERKHLIAIPRRINGRLYFTDDEMKLLTIIATLRCARCTYKLISDTMHLLKEEDHQLEMIEKIQKTCHEFMPCLVEIQDNSLKMIHKIDQMKYMKPYSKLLD